MSSKLQSVVGFIAHYKYLITIVIGVVLVGFVDENSFLKRVKYDMHINELKAEIRHFDEMNAEATRELRDLRRDPRAVERIARERYFMKADDEDIFVFSTDKVTNTQSEDLDDIANDETAQ